MFESAKTHKIRDILIANNFDDEANYFADGKNAKDVVLALQSCKKIGLSKGDAVLVDKEIARQQKLIGEPLEL